MTKLFKVTLLLLAILLSIAINGAHVKMADLQRWARSSVASLLWLHVTLVPS